MARTPIPGAARLSRRLLVGLALAALAAALVLVLTRPVETRDVFVAAANLQARVPLGRELLETRAVTDPAGLVEATSLPDPANMMLASPLAAGEPLVPSLLLPVETEDTPDLMALSLDEDHAVLGRIGPGDRIDLYVTRPGNGLDEAVTELLAAAVYVTEARIDEAALSGRPTVRLLVAVDQELAAALAAAIHTGEIDVVRRAR